MTKSTHWTTEKYQQDDKKVRRNGTAKIQFEPNIGRNLRKARTGREKKDERNDKV